MRKIKLSTNGESKLLARQTPGLSLQWEGNQFFVNNAEEKFDWWVIYDGLLQKEKINVRGGHTIFLTGEPPAIKHYNKQFLEQFDLIITSQPDIQGKNVIHTQTALPWTFYQTIFGQIDMKLSKNYDDLKKTISEKTKLLSVVTSNKNHTEGHRNRLEFISKLQQHFGDRIDVFGPGFGLYGSTKDKIKFKYHVNKWEALKDYKYHIAIENSECPDYWTEKISEPFLSETYPFYYGCPNIFDYFSPQSLTKIDILNPKEAILIIEKKIKEDEYEKSLVEIRNAKKLVLDKYQLFPMLADMFEKNQSETNHVSRIIYPEVHFQNTLYKKILQKIKFLIKNILGTQRTEKNIYVPSEGMQKWMDETLKNGMVVFKYFGNKSRSFDVRKTNNKFVFTPHLPRNTQDNTLYPYIDKLYYFPDNYFDEILITEDADIDDSDIELAKRKVKTSGTIFSEKR